jgi:uncharacterized protein (DUF1778 family)
MGLFSTPALKHRSVPILLWNCVDEYRTYAKISKYCPDNEEVHMARLERIDFRVDEAVKAQFTHAAETYGMNLSTFMIAAAQEQVARARRRFDTLNLSDTDRGAFLQALDQPVRPLPTALAKATRRRGTRILSD